ncbi:hypothetical protein MKW98_022394 [Papaver atlanticum]|uniref:Bet v I/Major latex protein domain-containing protein n=1 Tax=Papaver atlanticum TaxID=357466 RepID=A0AAD4TAN5_9MAGN|nr:hypothetical protein MKW98_022394 [Papaver atlanticum]
MAQIHRLHAEVELKNCTADQFYGFLKNEMTTLPQVIPHIFKSFQILAGDGKSEGTIWLSKVAMGTSHVEMAKEKIEAIDDESRTFSVSVVDGDILRMYPKFEYTLAVTPLVTQGSEQSCLLKLSVEYEKENEDVPHPHQYVEVATSSIKAIASHLANKS